MSLPRPLLAGMLAVFASAAAYAMDSVPTGRGRFYASGPATSSASCVMSLFDAMAKPSASSRLAGSMQTMSLTNPGEPAPRITELAAALDHDPVKLYRFVKTRIRYVPYLGFVKGAERTLIDGAGNDADQSLLLMELLNASGYEPILSYAMLDPYWDEWGMAIPLRGESNGYDAESWLGLTNGLAGVTNLLYKAGIYYAVAEGSSPETTWILTERFFVKCVIGSETVYFDPSFKPCQRWPARDVLAEAGYSRANLLSAAGGTSDVARVRDLDAAALREELARLTAALTALWATNGPDMEGREAAGGDAIRQTQDDGGLFGDCPNDYDFLTTFSENYQNSFRTLITVELGGMTNAMWMDEVAAHRLRVTFTNAPGYAYPKAKLELDGEAIAEEAAGSDQEETNAWISVDNWLTGRRSESYPMNRGVTNVYTIPMSFGVDGGFGMREEANRRLAAYAADGETSHVEVVSRSLEALGQDWLARADGVNRLTAALDGNPSVMLYRVGVAGQDRSPFVDMKSAYGYTADVTNRLRAEPLISSAFEHAAVEQAQGTNRPAVSTMRVLDLANTDGQYLFLLNSNTVASVRGQMTNYPPYLLDAFEANTAEGWSYFLPQNGRIVFHSWTGLVYLAFAQTPAGFATYTMIGRYAGGSGADPGVINVQKQRDRVSILTPMEVVRPQSIEPVDLYSGAYLKDKTDLASAGPGSLVWSRHYNSGARGRKGPLGWGWTHGYDARLSFYADPNAAFGGRAPADCAASLLGTAVIEDLLSSGSEPLRLGVACLIASWTAESQTDGAVSVTVGNRAWTFTRQPDGSYTAPPGMTATLACSNGLFTLRERLGPEWRFDASNRLESVQYPDGNGLGLVYDEQDRLSNVTNSFGRTLAIGYDASGLIDEVEDDAGRRVTYSYDSDGDLTNVTDACGANWTISTDDRHRIVSLTDPEGIVTIQNAYNGLDRVTNQIAATGDGWRFGFAGPGASGEERDPDGRVNRYGFDERGRTVEQIAKDGSTNRLYYDGQNQVTQSVNAVGVTNLFYYDGRHNLLLTVEAAGTPDVRSNAFGYDSQDRLIAITDAVDRVFRMTYDEAHRLTSVTAPDGVTVTNAFNDRGLLETIRTIRGGVTLRETQIGYNAQGLPITVSSTDAGTVSNSYDAAGNLTAVMDGRGNETRFQYDACARLTNTIDAANNSWPRVWWRNGLARSAADPLGRVTEWDWAPSYKLAALRLPGGGVWSNGYDAADRLAWSVDARLQTTDFNRDAMGRLTERIGPISEDRFYYDGMGNVTTVVDGAWARTELRYDRLNRPVNEVDPLSYTSTVTRNALGWPVGTVDPRGRETDMDYDPMGRLTRLTKPSGRIETLGYDALGRPSAYTNAAGQAFRLTWDAQGRLLAATNALGEEVERLAYDAAGNLIEKVDGAGRSAVFAYDCLNRATNAAYADGDNLSFAFDAAGSLIRAEGPGATNTFGYGADGALAASTSTAGGVTFQVHYLRDAAGNVTNLVYPDGRGVAYDYDAENRLTEMRDWTGRVYRFERDGAGRVLGVAFPNGVTNAWTRDQAGRVTGWRYEKSSTALMERNFTLDAVGRILEADYAAGPEPAFPAARRLDFAHNAADRITESGVTAGSNVENSVWLYDGAGAVTNGGGRSYVYGARGLLEQAWGTNVDFEAAYDALGNRIWERNGGVERRFAVDHADPFKRPLVETDAAGTVIRRYVWGPDRLLAVEEADGTLRVALTDERGSVAGLANEAGALTDAFVYGPYGEDWGRTGTNALAFRWLGGYGVRHAGGSLYVTRFRAYDAEARRFLSADPLGLAGGGNLYAYGAGDPMFFIDPLGLCEADSYQGQPWYDRTANRFRDLIDSSVPELAANYPDPIAGLTLTLLELEYGIVAYPQVISRFGEGTARYYYDPRWENLGGVFADVSIGASVLSMGMLGLPSAKMPLGTTAKTATLELDKATTWGRAETLTDHFGRHGADFGATTADEYANMASRFLQESQAAKLPTKIDSQGVIRLFDPKTGTFGSFNPNGTTRTFFKPPNASAYFDRQPGTLFP